MRWAYININIIFYKSNMAKITIMFLYLKCHPYDITHSIIKMFITIWC